ncbi:hypothetical protein J6590_092005 [Homalodisca vitripennis]|nr:hypothetical protein J6590_092005 [Homalodisca vitripennis]
MRDTCDTRLLFSPCYLLCSRVVLCVCSARNPLVPRSSQPWVRWLVRGNPLCGPRPCCPSTDCRLLASVVLGYCCGCALPIDRLPWFARGTSRVLPTSICSAVTTTS